MISPSGQNSGSVAGAEEWRHGAVELWMTVAEIPQNPSSWTCKYAGQQATFTTTDGGRERPGMRAGARRYRRCEMKDELLLWEQREPPMPQRQCLPARTLIPPSRASIITKWDFPLIGARAKKKNKKKNKNVQLKKAGALSAQMRTQAGRARARTALLTVTDVAPQLLRVHKSKACDGN